VSPISHTGPRYIHNISDSDSTKIGEKAENLKYLSETGYHIPDTLVCNFDAYDEYVKGASEIFTPLEGELQQVINPAKSYSVRSSANIEDQPGQSFAGQFRSYLNVQGTPAILASIEDVWQSTTSEKLLAYLKKFTISRDTLKMGVIIQEMVHAKLSGVIFTKNPMNGRDEVIVEAVSGLGDQLMAAGVTPYRWVYKWGDFIEHPEESVIDLTLIQHIVKQAQSIAKTYGKPLNLEWSYDGEVLFWLQLREITTLTGLNFYSNKISKEFLPGLIKPLVWSVNIPLVCGAWIDLLTEIIGENDLQPDDLAKSFYYRAYFNMGIIGDVFDAFGMPREGLELLMGFEVAGAERPTFKPSLKSIRLLPRLLRFSLDKTFFSRKLSRFLQKHQERMKDFHLTKLSTLNEEDTIQIIDELFEVNKNAAYFVIISQLLNSAYNMILKRIVEAKGFTLSKRLFTLESYADINPNHYLSRLNAELTSLPAEIRKRVRTMTYDELAKTDHLSTFKEEVDAYIRRFGHLSDQGNDFSSVPWRESPDLVLTMITNYLKREKERTPEQNLPTLLKGYAKVIYSRAKTYSGYKERISFLYTYSFGLFRPYFLHLGEIFTEKGYIERANDIFYLTFNEVKHIVSSQRMAEAYSTAYRKRKLEMARCEDIELPDVIYGDDPPIPIKKSAVRRELKGIAASKGYYQGKVQVVKNLKDFDKVKEGDILVIPHSDIGWAPLFAKARAVISEAGGMLSHSAIVAREYGIPAVVGVEKACELPENLEVIVDGFNGRVIIVDAHT